MSRYAGSKILGYELRQFDELTLPLGPSTRNDDIKMDFEATKHERLEGKLTRILYVVPEDRSSLEVTRNYEQALTKAGFKTLYTCAAVACSPKDGWLKYLLYPQRRRLENTKAADDAFSFPKDERYLAAKLSRPEGDVYASVYTAIETFDYYKEMANHPITLLEVIETKPMETNMVTVDAAAMSKDIQSTGHVTLYGIYFDTNSAAVKPESGTTLQEIAALMKRDPKLTLFVVGHTDNVGGYQSNMDLSQRRAASVVTALAAQHGVDAKRLRPAGVGLLSPVASNDAEPGRAKNRRVELVKQ